MCFSIKVPKNNKELEAYFKAQMSEEDVANVQNLFSIQANVDRKIFNQIMGTQLSKKPLGLFKLPSEDQRILPGYFANVVVVENETRFFKPMRYQVRPAGSTGEIEGIYNARFDSLTIKKTWQPLFMRKHGLVPFTNFYEWVPDPDLGLFNFLDDKDKADLGENSKKKLITFLPENREIMWAPCLWDEWTSANGEITFSSFAIITDDPPKEVEIMGHDRCPIFMKEEYIEEWLNPQRSNVTEILEILKSREPERFIYKWA